MVKPLRPHPALNKEKGEKMKRTELDILVTDFVSEILIKTFKNESDLTF